MLYRDNSKYELRRAGKDLGGMDKMIKEVWGSAVLFERMSPMVKLRMEIVGVDGRSLECSERGMKVKING